MDWEIFFKELKDCLVATYTFQERMSNYYKNREGLIIEELYQAFKARLIKELNLKLQTKCPDCNSHAIFWEEDYSCYRCCDCGWVSNDKA